MKIGVHPMNLHLRLAQHWPDTFAALDPLFVSYQEGRDTGRLIAQGKIDVGGTGSTPPLIARSAGMPVVYLAASAPRPANGALMVGVDAAIRSLADLAGKRVALLDGSFHTYLLARSLELVGKQLKDVTRVEMPPAAARAALLAGEVDVWVAMAPQIDQALAAKQARVLALCGETIPNRSVFWTLEDLVSAPLRLARLVCALVRLGDKIAAHPERAARLLAGPKASSAALAQWEKVVRGRDWRIFPATPALIAEQQAEADTLWRHGDLPAQLQLSGHAFISGA